MAKAYNESPEYETPKDVVERTLLELAEGTGDVFQGFTRIAAKRVVEALNEHFSEGPELKSHIHSWVIEAIHWPSLHYGAITPPYIQIDSRCDVCELLGLEKVPLLTDGPCMTFHTDKERRAAS